MSFAQEFGVEDDGEGWGFGGQDLFDAGVDSDREGAFDDDGGVG